MFGLGGGDPSELGWGQTSHYASTLSIQNVSYAHHHNQLLRQLINPDAHGVTKFSCRICGPGLVKP
jgi:hypothetical protein